MPLRSLALLLASLMTALAATEGVAAFNSNVNAYVKLRSQVLKELPRLDKKVSPAEIEKREASIAQGVRQARIGAKQGDIFTLPVKAMFQNLLRAALTGPDSSDRRSSIAEGNPKVEEKAPGQAETVIQVNVLYPKSAPLSTVPPTLLEKLPQLPRGLEYRFVGRTLILRDRECNLIVDYLPEAVPAR